VEITNYANDLEWQRWCCRKEYLFADDAFVQRPSQSLHRGFVKDNARAICFGICVEVPTHKQFQSKGWDIVLISRSIIEREAFAIHSVSGELVSTIDRWRHRAATRNRFDTTYLQDIIREAFIIGKVFGVFDDEEIFLFEAKIFFCDIPQLLKDNGCRDNRSEERRVGKECRCWGWPNRQIRWMRERAWL